MLTGEAVVVLRREQTGTDDFNEPIYEWTETPVEDVLTSPGPREDLPEATRPDGVQVAWTCHFPRDFTGSLRGARVKVRNDEPRNVVGDPQPYLDHLTPGRWNRPVELEGTDG